MFKNEAIEGGEIMRRALQNLLGAVRGDSDWNADLRTACNRLIFDCPTLIQNDEAGPPLIECFRLAQNAEATQKQIRFVREGVEAETTKTIGAALIKNCIVQTCLLTESRIIAGMAFTSRDDVDAVKLLMNEAFSGSEEIAADDMDQMTYRALVELHAAVTFYLVGTGRPLPRMVRFQFAMPMPSLQIAQRLYYDARRADELRAENHVVHPAFMRPRGRALSA